ncbi:MAG: MlaD family protein [Caenispirillum sp.]|nr:MlaD family protein [Caenispirillum sp.]
MNSRTRETLYGLATVSVVGVLLTYNVLQRHERHVDNGAIMTLTAQFNRTDGLREGAPVRLAGVPVGVVSDMRLTDRYMAETVLSLRGDVELPDDSAAIIETEGLFGTKYIELQPGGGLDLLADGDRISYTQDAVILEELLAKIVARAKAARAAAAEGGDILAPADTDGDDDAGDAGEAGGPAGTAAPPGASPFPSLTD